MCCVSAQRRSKKQGLGCVKQGDFGILRGFHRAASRHSEVSLRDTRPATRRLREYAAHPECRCTPGCICRGGSPHHLEFTTHVPLRGRAAIPERRFAGFVPLRDNTKVPLRNTIRAVPLSDTPSASPPSRKSSGNGPFSHFAQDSRVLVIHA